MKQKRSTADKDTNSGTETLNDWIQTATTYWQNLAQQQTAMLNQLWTANEDPTATLKEQAENLQRSVLNTMRLMQSLMQNSMQSDSQWTGKGAQFLPDMFIELTRHTWESALKMQQEAMSRATAFQQSGSGSNPFQHLHKNLFSNLGEIYEKELQKFLRIPQLGLTRAYQTHWNAFADQAALYQTAAAEFGQVLSEPFQRSLTDMQTKINELLEKDELPEDPEKLYGMWIKHLEGQYMALLQSPQYVKALNTLLTQQMQFVQTRDRIWYDLLQSVPVPTNEDMNALYEEVYLLKKRLREVEQRLAAQGESNEE